MRQAAATIIAAIRTILWAVAFFAGSAVVVIAAALVGYVSRPALLVTVQAWALWHRWCVRFVLGQSIVVEGALPSGANFLVFKHEAMFETVDVLLLFDCPVVFAKRELFDIPLWGRMALRYGLIPIERDAGATALRTMRRAAQAAIECGRPIALFPEGTRVRHGLAPSIHSGFAGVYKLLRMPAVPIAVDSGRLTSHGWIRWPGTITYRVGEVIPPGLPRNVAEQWAYAAINTLNSCSIEQPACDIAL